VTTHVREDVDKEKHSFIAVGIANHSGNQSGISSENWKQVYLKTQLYHSWEYTQKMPNMPQGHMFHYVLKTVFLIECELQ
jgi:hypothetical protein